MAYTLVHTLGLESRSVAGVEVVVLGTDLFRAVVEVRTGASWVVAMVTGKGVCVAAAAAAVSVFALAVAGMLRAVWVMKVAGTVVGLAAGWLGASRRRSVALHGGLHHLLHCLHVDFLSPGLRRFFLLIRGFHYFSPPLFHSRARLHVCEFVVRLPKSFPRSSISGLGKRARS